MRFDSSADVSFEGLLAAVNGFKTGGKTKIIIHGYTEYGTTDWIVKMKDAYYDSGK